MSVITGTSKSFFIFSSICSPLVRPGPRKDLYEDRFALSNDPLNIKLNECFFERSTNVFATSEHN